MVGSWISEQGLLFNRALCRACKEWQAAQCLWAVPAKAGARHRGQAEGEALDEADLDLTLAGTGPAEGSVAVTTSPHEWE